MGGRAFPHLHVPRLSPVEYQQIRNDYTKILQKFYAQVVCPPEAPEKADHGDVDFLVSDPVVGFSSEKLRHALRAVEETGHKPNSFAVPLLRDEDKPSYAQIDVKLCGNMQWEIWMSAYGDMSQIIALLLHPLGLRMTNKGLFLKLKLSSQESSPVFLTKNPAKAREFLGLNEEGYQRGFQTLKDLFEWCSGGRFFQAPPTWCKATGRSTYDLFLSWASSHAEIWASHTSASRREVLHLAVAFFGVEQQVRLEEDRDHKITAIAAAISEIKDSSEMSKLPKVERWIRFEDDGSPILRPISGENEPVRMLRSEWLDSIREGHLEQLLDWLKANLAELERREKVWITKKILNQQLTDAFYRSIKQAPQKFGHVGSKRFKKEFLEGNTLDSAWKDSKLLEQYHSCKKLIDDMTSLDPEEKLHAMIEEFKSL